MKLEKVNKIPQISSRNRWWAAVILFTLCLLSYGNSFHKEFMLDDNYVLLGPSSLANTSFEDIFFYGYKNHYRPIAHSALKGASLIFGQNIILYHVLNLSLFFLMGVLFFFILLRLFNDFNLSILASSLFIIHPINNVLINYNTSGMISIYIICMQASTLFFIYCIDSQRGIYLALSVLFYALSLLSHEMSFILPVFLLIIARFRSMTNLSMSVRKCAPYLILFLFYFLGSSQIGHSRIMYNFLSMEISFADYLANIAKLITWYVSKLFIPVDILFVWDIDVFKKSSFLWSILAVVSGLAFIFIAFIRKKKDFMGFHLSFILAGFLPLGIASFVYVESTRTALIEPHWLTFASIGFYALLAKSFLYISKISPKKIGTAVTGIVFFTLIFLTQKSNKYWANERTYCTHWIQVNPINGTPWNLLARDYIKTNEKNKALQMLTKVDSTIEKEQSYLAYLHRANFQKLFGLYNSAIEDYSKSIQLNPQCFMAYNSRGIIYLKSQYVDFAIDDFRKTLEIKSDYNKAYNNLGIALNRKGLYEEAVSNFTKSIQLDPDEYVSYFNRGISYMKLGQPDLAIADYSRVIQFNSKNAAAYKNRSIAYQTSGEWEKALRDARTARRLGEGVNIQYIEYLQDNIN